MEVDDSASFHYRPHMEAENQRLDVAVKDLETPSIGERESIREVDDSQPVGAPAVVSAVGGGEGGCAADVEMKAVAMNRERGGDGKRKRGRPSRAQGRPKMKMEEEDVCFICFDGGSLVLCDRRCCPKAYHPACIKRDEAFFQSKGKWNCGWHICSSCRKAAHYMCYTCTFSLCKGCTKDADYVRVRGNKGFCTTCLKTIMLIEDKEQGNNKTDQVDFDDKTSWEYLFKIYWIYLKENLSLTFTELTNAKSPWKESGTTIGKRQLMDLHDSVNDGKGSDKSGSEKVTTLVGSPIVSLSSLKPPEVAGDHAASPTSNGFQLTHSTPFDPASNACSWQAIFGEPIEFSTLAEESVSDLLAEVDAMESQGGLASPTSVMKCGEEMIQGSNNDTFSSVGGLSPTPDPVKSDALSWKFGIEHE